MYRQPSPQLASQTIDPKTIASLLAWEGRTEWEDKYNPYDFVIQTWANGIWVKQAGLISYQALAEWLKYVAQAEASMLSMQRRGDRLCLVQGRRQSWYAVVHQEGQWRCECALYRCRQRIKTEMPLLYQSLEEQIFCHHTEAAKQRSLDY